MLGAVRRRGGRRAPGGSFPGSAGGADGRTRHRHVGRHRRRHSPLCGRSGAGQRPPCHAALRAALGRGAPGRSPRRRPRAPRDPVPRRDPLGPPPPWRVPACRSAFSVPVPRASRRCGPPPRTRRSVRSWPGTAGWSWRSVASPRSSHPRCSSSAPGIRRCACRTSGPDAGCGANIASPWSPRTLRATGTTRATALTGSPASGSPITSAVLRQPVRRWADRGRRRAGFRTPVGRAAAGSVVGAVVPGDLRPWEADAFAVTMEP